MIESNPLAAITLAVRPSIIGLTGGIASGKSSVLNWLRAKGCSYLDSDELSRKVILPGQPAWKIFVALFGEHYLLPDGSVDRKRLGDLVFSDAEARHKLEGIIHPAVVECLQRGADEHRRFLLANPGAEPPKPLVLDIPLLFEAELEYLVDQCWCVWVTAEVQLLRLRQRNQLSEEEALRRIAAQLSLDEKKKLATVVIDNSGRWAETEAQLQNIWRSYEPE